MLKWKFYYHIITFIIVVCNVYAFDENIGRLAIDFGPRLIGFAFSNRFFIKPLFTKRNKEDVYELCNDVFKIADDAHAEEIIIGVPLLSSQRFNDESPFCFNAQLCINFASAVASLSNHFSYPYKVVYNLYNCFRLIFILFFVFERYY